MLGIVEHCLQLHRIGQQHLLGQVDHHAPGLGVGNRADRVHGADQVALLEYLRRTATQRLLDVFTFGAQGVADALANLAGVDTVGGEHAAAGDDQHVPGVVEQLALGVDGRGLQGVEGDVDTDDADDLAVHQQRQGNGGHQHFLVRDGVGVRVQQAGPLAVPGAGVPHVVRRAAEVQGGLGHVFFDHDRVQRGPCGTAPVGGETTGFVGLARGVTDEFAVLAIQAVGFERQPDPQHLAVALEGGFQALVELLAQGAGLQRTLGGHGAHVLDLVRQGGHHRQGFTERLLHPHRLLGGLGLEQVLHTVGEHCAAGSADQFIVLIGLVEVHAHDRCDHAKQAQTGQQDDFQADGQ
ncbi:hypothetical protein D3C76_722010 [compost metagenome]